MLCCFFFNTAGQYISACDPGHAHRLQPSLPVTITETGISTRRHSLKVVMTALSQAVYSHYQEPSSRIWNPNLLLSALSRFCNILIHSSSNPSFALRFLFHTRPVSASMYSNNSYFVDEDPAVRTSLSSLSGMPTPWFTVSFHKFQFYFFFSTSYTEMVSITSSHIVCNGSTNTILVARAYLTALPESSKHSQILQIPRFCYGTTQRFFQKNLFSRCFVCFSPPLSLLVSKFGLWGGADESWKELQAYKQRYQGTSCLLQ